MEPASVEDHLTCAWDRPMYLHCLECLHHSVQLLWRGQQLGVQMKCHGQMPCIELGATKPHSSKVGPSPNKQNNTCNQRKRSAHAHAHAHTHTHCHRVVTCSTEPNPPAHVVDSRSPCTECETRRHHCVGWKKTGLWLPLAYEWVCHAWSDLAFDRHRCSQRSAPMGV